MKINFFSGAAFVVSSSLVSLCPAAEPASQVPSPVSPTETVSNTPSNQVLDPVVVTATRTPTPVSQTGSSVTVISREQMDQQQLRSVADALRNVPGMALSQSGGLGQTITVNTRGLTTRFNQILINGRRVAEGLSVDGDLTNLALDNVERIEVVRGPMSTLQGGNAVGSTINIITQKGTGLSKPEFTTQFEGGSFNTFSEAASARGASGLLDYSASISRFDTSNQRANNDDKRSNIDTHLGVQANKDLYLDLSGRYRDSTAQNPGPITGTGANDPDNYLQRESWSMSPGGSWQTTENWKQSLYYSHSQQRQATVTPNDAFPTNQRVQSDLDQVDYQNDIQALDSLSFTAGVTGTDNRVYQVDNDALTTTKLNNTDVSTFVGAQWEITKNWFLLPSARLAHYSDYGNEATWRMGTAYTIEASETLFKASYGTAFAPPELQNIVFATPVNPDLRPERSKAFELGFEQPFFKRKLTVGATYFQNNINNYVGLDPNTFVAFNLDQVRTQGVEVTISAHPVEIWTLEASYTYTDAQSLGSDGAINPDRLARSPRYLVNLQSTVTPIKGLVITAGGNWQIAREDGFQPAPLEDYFVARATASYQINSWVNVFTRLENAFNEQYSAVANRPALDRGLYGGVKLNY